MNRTSIYSTFFFARFVLLVSAMIFGGCSITYNFTGGTVNPDLNTISIEQFGNEAAIVVPSLGQELTTQMQDRFLSQSRLSLTSGSADIVISGAVTNYRLDPVAISGDNTAAQNRLTISVRVKFENNVEVTESWEQTFSGFVDFDADEDFASVELDKINEILEQLTQDVFNKSLGKW